MTDEATELIWREPPGWRAIEGTVEHSIAFDADAWAAAPRRFTPDAVSLYQELARAGAYGPWWAGICGGSSPSLRRFLIRTDRALWECPWEAQIAALDRRYWANVSLVRAVDGEARIPQQTLVEEALRVLVLQGAEEGDGLARLDLEAEFEALKSARDGLDQAAYEAVAPIVRNFATLSNLTSVLTEGRANMLWFSGHGRADPPGLLLSDGHWLTPEALAEAIGSAMAAGAPAPLYVMLWACRTGLPERFTTSPAAPPFVAALAKLGVSAVVTTQAPLADSFARDFAGGVLSNVAAGLPIDHALARTRGAAMPQQLDNGATDWACPTVWAVDLPVDHVSFSALSLGVRRQELGRRLAATALAPDPPDAAGQEQSGTWLRNRRVWVTSPTSDAAVVRAAWLSRMLYQQRLGPEAAIILDLAATTVQAGLQEWAECLLSRASHSDDPDRRLRTAATLMRKDPEGGWTALCGLAEITLGVVAPMDAPDWFWTRLAGAAGRVCVLDRSFPPARNEEAWQVDTLMTQRLQHIDALAADPQVAALAVLAAPAQRNDIDAVAAGRFPAWVAEGLADQTRAGCVMPLGRAEAIARVMTEEQLRAAHAVAFRYLDGARARSALQEPQEALRKARLLHAKAGALQEAVLASSQDLMSLHRNLRRPAALLGVFEQVRALHRGLDEVWKVSAGWAFLQVGNVPAAKVWLNAANTDRLDEADHAVRDLNLAEAEKASGQAHSKARARALIEAVLERTATDIRLRPQHYAAQHDLARLTHFVDHHPADAIPAYQAVEQAWAEAGGHRLERAIAYRNLAEAQMTVAEQAPQGEAMQRLTEARRSIESARDLMSPSDGHSVVSELEYVAGRLLSRLGDDQEVIVRQFERCRSKALDTNHLMLAAIVEARLFWLQRNPEVPFDPGTWRERVEALQPFLGHGWAARVVINGHIRAAQIHARSGEKRPATQRLLSAKAIADANPAFDQGDDRSRTAIIHAGLAQLEPDQGWWDQFQAMYAWAPAWATGVRVESKNVWAEEI